MGSALALGGGTAAPPAEPVSPSFLHRREGGPGLTCPHCPSPARHQMKNAAWESCPQHWRPAHPAPQLARGVVCTPHRPPTVSGACGCVQHLARSQLACVKQDVWMGLRSPGPQGRLSQPRPCIHTGQSGGLGHPAPPGETAAQRRERGHTRPDGGWAVRGPLLCAPRPAPHQPSSHLAPQAAAGQGNRARKAASRF